MTALIWAAVKPWLKSLNMWLVLAIVGLSATIYIGAGRLRALKADVAKHEAVATHATGTVAAAVETAKAEREAEAETPLPADKAAILDLCKRSASCRERGAR